jgi:hypothetical protein
MVVQVGAESAFSAVTAWLVQEPVPAAAPVEAIISVPFHLKYPPVAEEWATCCHVGLDPKAKIPSPRTADAVVVSLWVEERRLWAVAANVPLVYELVIVVQVGAPVALVAVMTWFVQPPDSPKLTVDPFCPNTHLLAVVS